MTLESVPVVDVSRLTPRALSEIDFACREWGFFQIVGHGIDPGLFAALQREMHDFFARPLEEKRRVERSAENPWGFYDRELTQNTRDWKQIFDCGQEGDPTARTPWPADAPEFRRVLTAYSAACEGVAQRVLGAIAVNLGVAPGRLARAFQPAHTSFLRLNYYPPCPHPEPSTAVGGPPHVPLGVHAHTDAGALTLLLQDDVPGLEVDRDGAWHAVDPRPDALVVNIGDIVQVWSNDRYRASLHRVRASLDRPRFTAPYFYNPAYESCYAPLPTTTGEGAHYRPIRWGEFRALRAAGDYQDCGEEVQIHHYRLGAPPSGARHEETCDDLH